MVDITKEVLECFGEEYVVNYYRFLYEKAEAFLKQNNIETKIIFNKQIFDKMFIDIMIDLKRLALYHNIKNLNLIKLCTYAASWWLRRKPYQLSNEDETEEYIYINECFVRTLLFLPILDKKTHDSQIEEKQMIELRNHLHHHLKYRNVNPQTLELFVESLVCRPNLYDA